MPSAREFCRSLLRSWNSALPMKLKTVKGNARFYVGITVQSVLAFCFAYLIYLGMVSNSTTTYMSLDYTKYEIIRNPRTITNCSEIALTVSTDLTIDEAGNWSTSTFYEKLNTMKEVSFISYSGDITVFNQEMDELNSCIEQVNTFCSESLFPSSLLYLAFKTCSTSSGTIEVTFPINFAYVFDFTVSGVTPLAYNESSSYYELYEPEDSSMDGTLEQSGSLLKLTVTCAEGFGAYPKDICGYAYQYFEYYNYLYELYGITLYDLDNLPETEFEVNLNLDSIVRCVAVNSEVYNASYTDDFLILETNSFGYATMYKAVYTNTDGPNVMYLDTEENSCYLLYEDSDKSMFLQPSMEFVDSSCNVDCDNPQRNACESEMELSIQLTVYSIFDLSVFGAVSLDAYGSQGYINDYFYYFQNSTGLSCKPLVNLLPLGNETELPFTLVEGYFKCTQRLYTSWSTVLASAYSNSQLLAEFLILFSIFVVVKIRKRSVSFQYDDGEVEIATLELAVERIKEKRDMGLSTDEFHSIQHSEGWKAKSIESN